MLDSILQHTLPMKPPDMLMSVLQLQTLAPSGGAILPFSVTILPGEGGYVKIMFIQFIGAANFINPCFS